jgi:hypothetical protein
MPVQLFNKSNRDYYYLLVNAMKPHTIQTVGVLEDHGQDGVNMWNQNRRDCLYHEDEEEKKEEENSGIGGGGGEIHGEIWGFHGRF